MIARLMCKGKRPAEYLAGLSHIVSLLSKLTHDCVPNTDTATRYLADPAQAVAVCLLAESQCFIASFALALASSGL